MYAVGCPESKLVGHCCADSLTACLPVLCPVLLCWVALRVSCPYCLGERGMCLRTLCWSRLQCRRVVLVSAAVSPPWPSGLKRWNQTLVPVVRARFEPRCGRPHFAPTRSGVRVCGRNRTKAREREWAEGTVSSLPGTLNVRIKFCHSTGIARSGGGVRVSTTSYAL